MVKRREFLKFLAASAVSIPFQAASYEAAFLNKLENGSLFIPIKGPMPVVTDGVPPDKQPSVYARYDVLDDLVLPEGYTYDIIGMWGDPLGDSRFGYNNDYLSFVETARNAGYLTINFEYISAKPWLGGYRRVVGKDIPLDEVIEAAKAAGSKGINAFALPDSDPLKAKIRQVCIEALIDQGLGVISIRRTTDGRWARTRSPADRRITGVSGLNDGRYLKTTGPARAVFLKKSGQGYIDKLGDKIIGSFANCAGGTTPWGTVLSGEENIQYEVPDPVYPDGTSFDPSAVPFKVTEEGLDGQANVLGLAGNKYGWIVEVDPANPADYGTKHTWLGRYRHEAVGVRVVRGRPLAFYSGCDRRGGHIYKFVSLDRVRNPASKLNSRLLENGMLYAAKFYKGGTGRWIPLRASTPVAPDLPSDIEGNMIPLPKRPEGGFFNAKTDAEVEGYKQKHRTLGDLYTGNAEEQQGAILIDAHYAANAAGATCTARPEDTEIAPDGSLYIAFTSGWPGSDGGPDRRVFVGPCGNTAHEYGFVMRLIENENDPAALSFKWSMFALGGEPCEGGAGFSNPDNLLIDPRGNVWIVTDIFTEKHNRAVPHRADPDGKLLNQNQLGGLFGNNSMWYIPVTGPDAGEAFKFASGPMESELTGPFLTRDERTLFLSVQHPGELHGIRRDDKSETR
ncbi:MAG TPA: alkaline phosphatase PhoX, partial [Blastocatellia bacterium]|nr:alkaline phosphatase PhoX [Blastocatellia bacterium]